MIQDLLHSHITSSLSFQIKEGSYEIQIPPAGQEGDFAVPCFPFAKILGKSPVEAAQLLGASLESDDLVSSVQVAGPFVNVTLRDDFYSRALSGYEVPMYEQKDKNVVVDYIGANIGKPLHVGHLCTPSYGQAIINLLRYRGYNVIGDVHQGDWGIIFGKLIVAWKKFGDDAKFEENAVDHLLDLYVQVSNAAKDDESLEEEFRETFKRLAAGDKEMVELWKRFTGVSIERLNEVMERLLVKYDYAVGESFYEGLDLPPVTDQPNLPKPECVMSEIVEELIDKGIATRNDDGSAGITFPKESKLPSVMLQKRNGTHGYLASDLSTIRYRKIVWDVSKIIVCTDVPQKLHFQQVFWTTKQAGWGFENVELYHSINGSVRLKEGAMSTRKGRIVRLEEVLDEGEARVSEILKEKGRELDASDIAGISVGAIKYAFLAQDRERDIIFDWDKILAFEGNSGPYVQYSIVRIRKLLEQLSDIKDVKDTPELTQYDKKLVQDLLFFEAELDQAATTYKFHGLVSYCYEMANHVNSFYTNTGKLTEEKNTDLKAFRVQLLRKILSVFELSFEILALPIPNKM